MIEDTRDGTIPFVEYVYTHTYSSPIGPLHTAVDRNGTVHAVSFVDVRPGLPADSWEENKYACGELEYQLDEYFAGRRTTFSLSVHLPGTNFQRAVWNRMRKIGYGTTMSYGTLAQKIGRRNAAQAVGNAVGLNPVVIVVPCHRIVRANGDIGSYARRSLDDSRGRAIKEQLLRLEGIL